MVFTSWKEHNILTILSCTGLVLTFGRVIAVQKVGSGEKMLRCYFVRPINPLSVCLLIFVFIPFLLMPNPPSLSLSISLSLSLHTYPSLSLSVLMCSRRPLSILSLPPSLLNIVLGCTSQSFASYLLYVRTKITDLIHGHGNESREA